MGEWNTDIPKHSAVGQVALQAADGQFFAEMAKQGIGDSEIAFRVFKVDRIHLVRHGRRTYFARFDALPEIVHAYVSPDIAAQIGQYGIDAPGGVEQGRKVVVVLDLGGHIAAFQAERLVHKADGELFHSY